MSIEEANYWRDPRTRAAHKEKKFTVDIKAQRLVLTPDYSEYFIEHLADVDGLEDTDAAVARLYADGCMELPGDDDWDPSARVSVPVHVRYGVCGLCAGHGTVVNPSIDCGGLTKEDFDEDPDFREDYFSGRYDVTCPECNGLRVAPEWKPAADKWSVRVAGWLADWERSEAESYAEMAAERRMGA